MKISIITVCYNSASTIENTIQSVLNQTYPNVEYIIIDGASTDNTLEVIKRYQNISVVVSEPDKGIYDAVNKGIGIASGDVIGMLNADDFYINQHVLSDVAKVFENESVEGCFADLVYVDQKDTNKIVRYWKSQSYKSGLFKQGWMPAHPTFFARKNVYEKYGGFDLGYKIAADFELLFHLIEKYKIKTIYLPKVIIKMRLGGTTNKNLRNIFIQNQEIVRVLRGYYQDFSVFQFWLSKILNRLIQFTARPPGFD